MRTIKELREERNGLVTEMEKLLDEVDKRETPEFSEEETKRYNETDKKIKALSEQIRRLENLEKRKNTNEGSKGASDKGCKRGDSGDEGGSEDGSEDNTEDDEENEKEEERAFLDLVLGRRTADELRAASNLTFGDNGAIVPKHIAKQITETLENICPIYNLVKKFHFKGTVAFPVLDTAADDVVCAYAEEFTELESHVPKFASVNISGYLFGSLAKISLTLINNSDIPVLGYIVNRMAYAKKKCLEKELLLGTENKMTGILSTENIMTAAAEGAITADELIDLQAMIPDELQNGCCFIMHPSTRTAIRKLKDKDGNYIFNCDITTGFKPVILSKPVYISDKMPKMEAGKAAIFYGDPSGLYLNDRESNSVIILREKYATEHAVGVNLWFECDSKIVEKQKLAVLKMKSAV